MVFSQLLKYLGCKSADFGLKYTVYQLKDIVYANLLVDLGSRINLEKSVLENSMF